MKNSTQDTWSPEHHEMPISQSDCGGVLTAQRAIIPLNVLANDVFPFHYAYIQYMTSAIIQRPQKEDPRMAGMTAIKASPILPAALFLSRFIRPTSTNPKSLILAKVIT
jgi:hypothetical protein